MITDGHISTNRGAGGAGDDTAECKTKARIVAVAERMIAERGVQQFSIRDITSEAGVNLAAINYHFGSKERLIAEVLTRRVLAINEARRALLDKLEADTAGGTPGVRAVMEVIINTLLFSDEKERTRNMHTMKMFSRLFLDPDAEIVGMLSVHFRPFKARILNMLARALPRLEREELEWRANQLFGLLAYHALFEEMRCKNLGKTFDVKKEQRRLLDFCVAALQMPSETQAVTEKAEKA
jgi:AcrR family transcriptional regulator